MAGYQNAEVIDELLVSLGLKTDSDSFKKGSSAVSELKNGFLQLASLAGGGLGLKAVTMDLADSIRNMEMLSRATGFTIDKLRFLKHAFVTAGLSEQGADNFARQLKSIDLQVKSNTLSQGAYKSGAFSPQKYGALYTKNPAEAMEYLIDSLNKESNEAIRNEVLNSLPVTGESQEFFYNGIKGLDRAKKSWAQYGQSLPEGLTKDVDIFIEQMGILNTQFSQLSETLGEELLPVVNGTLKIINSLMGKKYDTPEDLLAGVSKTVYDAVSEYTEEKLGGFEYGKKFIAWAKDGGTFLASDGTFFTSKTKYENYEHTLSGEGVPQKGQSARKAANSSHQQLFSELEQKYGLPAGLLNATYQAESGGGEYLYSPAGALGPFQFLRPTANDMGLEGDDIFDVDKSADAAARYYVILLRRYKGDVAKAAAAYNHGLGNIDKKGLVNLPSETRNYIPKILGGLDDPDYLADYNYRMNQPPSFGNAVSGSAITIQQTNHSTVHASGTDAEEVGRVLQRQQTASLEQALAQTFTEKY